MSISPVSMSSAYRNNPIRFKGAEEKTQPETATPQEDDDKIVSYSTYGGNYAYPITVGQKRIAEEKQAALSKQNGLAKDNAVIQESPEDYYKRKLYSAEWSI